MANVWTWLLIGESIALVDSRDRLVFLTTALLLSSLTISPFREYRIVVRIGVSRTSTAGFTESLILTVSATLATPIFSHDRNSLKFNIVSRLGAKLAATYTVFHFKRETKVKTGCLGFVAILVFVLPTTANAGFIAIPISDEPNTNAEISSLENNLDSLSESYVESEVSLSLSSSLTQESPDTLLVDEYPTSSSVQSEIIEPVRVQEPGILALLGIGLIGMAMFRRSARAQQ